MPKTYLVLITKPFYINLKIKKAHHLLVMSFFMKVGLII